MTTPTIYHLQFIGILIWLIALAVNVPRLPASSAWMVVGLAAVFLPVHVIIMRYYNRQGLKLLE